MIGMFRKMKTRKAVAAMLLLPLVVFSFFSAGTMPGYSKQGFEIVICSGSGLTTVTVDADGQPVETEAYKTCEWSMLLHAAMALSADSVASAVEFAKDAAVFPRQAALSSQRDIVDIHVRGPPHPSA